VQGSLSHTNLRQPRYPVTAAVPSTTSKEGRRILQSIVLQNNAYYYHHHHHHHHHGSTTLYAEFWPSTPTPSIFFYPGQGSSNLAVLTTVQGVRKRLYLFFIFFF
jgi:hypothetical protein